MLVFLHMKPSRLFFSLSGLPGESLGLIVSVWGGLPLRSRLHLMLSGNVRMGQSKGLEAVLPLALIFSFSLAVTVGSGPCYSRGHLLVLQCPGGPSRTLHVSKREAVSPSMCQIREHRLAGWDRPGLLALVSSLWCLFWQLGKSRVCAIKAQSLSARLRHEGPIGSCRESFTQEDNKVITYLYRPQDCSELNTPLLLSLCPLQLKR